MNLELKNIEILEYVWPVDNYLPLDPDNPITKALERLGNAIRARDAAAKQERMP